MIRNSRADLTIRSEQLEVGISPAFGGSITRICHRSTGAEILWQTPWAEDAPYPPLSGPLEVNEWVRHSRGGWQVLLPNGGQACEWQDVKHGFHGESSVMPWIVTQVDDRGDAFVILKAALSTSPLTVERAISVTDGEVIVWELVTNRSTQPVDVIWTHHPGFGRSLLEGPVAIDTNARAVRLDDEAPVVGISATSGEEGRWPLVGGKSNPTDLRHPVDGTALLGYLSDFDGRPWVSIVREDGSLGVRLTWDGTVFPYCWMWQELGATADEPWHGEARVIGIEPSTSWPAAGLATVATTTGTTLTVAGRSSVSSFVTLSVFSAADMTSPNGESL